jgi:hypothetical protein
MTNNTTRKPPRRRFAQTMLIIAGAAATGVMAPSAFAATARTTPAPTAQNWVVNPGGPTTLTSGVIQVIDSTTDDAIKCQQMKMQGLLVGGPHGSDIKIGSISSATISSCTAPLGLTPTLTASASSANPWDIKAHSYNSGSGVTTASLTNIELGVSASGCSATVAGIAASAPGSVKVTYTNRTHTLKVVTSGLHFFNVSGCAGLFNNGDAVRLAGSYTTAPFQTITGP